jgi:hypothetical protein
MKLILDPKKMKTQKREKVKLEKNVRKNDNDLATYRHSSKK